VGARAAADARKAAGEGVAAEESVKLALDEARDDLTSSTNGAGEGRAVVADGAMERRGLGVARLVARRQGSARLEPACVPVAAGGRRAFGCELGSHTCTSVRPRISCNVGERRWARRPEEPGLGPAARITALRARIAALVPSLASTMTTTALSCEYSIHCGHREQAVARVGLTATRSRVVVLRGFDESAHVVERENPRHSAAPSGRLSGCRRCRPRRSPSPAFAPGLASGRSRRRRRRRRPTPRRTDLVLAVVTRRVC
jgi:hypothetical protein